MVQGMQCWVDGWTLDDLKVLSNLDDSMVLWKYFSQVRQQKVNWLLEPCLTLVLAHSSATAFKRDVGKEAGCLESQ